MLETLAAHRPDASRGHRRPVRLPSRAILWRATRASARSGWCGSVDLLPLRPTRPGAGSVSGGLAAGEMLTGGGVL